MFFIIIVGYVLRLVVKKKKLTKVVQDLQDLYSYTKLNARVELLDNFTRSNNFKFCIFWNSPRRQTHTHIFNLVKSTQRVFSVGRVLIKHFKKPKFYKVSMRGSNYYFLFLKNKVLGVAPKIYFFRVKKFTARQLVLMGSFLEVLKPEIKYLTCYKSYNSYTCYRRRLKRHIWDIVKRK